MESESKTEFAFKSGRRLIQQPEGVPLNRLFRSFSEEVLNVLGSQGLVIIGGESGLGKSEAFLSNSFPVVNAGGIVNILSERDMSCRVIDLQSALARRKIDKIISSIGPDERPQVVILDESLVLV